MVKCAIHNGFCETHLRELNDNGHCPVGEEFAPQLPAPQVATGPCPCCAWHTIRGVCGACGYQVKQPFPGMCEVCGERAAETGDFICMECISRMLVDME